MNERPSNFVATSIANFLAPLIDITTSDRTTLSHFRSNSEQHIAKLNETRRPLLLTIHGQTLLVCNADIYFDLETSRKRILSSIKTVEKALEVGKVEVSAQHQMEVECALRQVSDLEAEAADLRWREKELQKQLGEARIHVTEVMAAAKESLNPL
jgi:hypothetical protein